MSPEVVVYTFLSTAAVSIVYTVIVAIEVKTGKRFARKVREQLDALVVKAVRRARRGIRRIGFLYEQGEDAVEQDLIDPLTAPAEKTKQQYEKLKTGKSRLHRVSVKKLSPYLQNLMRDHSSK